MTATEPVLVISMVITSTLPASGINDDPTTTRCDSVMTNVALSVTMVVVVVLPLPPLATAATAPEITATTTTAIKTPKKT